MHLKKPLWAAAACAAALLVPASAHAAVISTRVGVRIDPDQSTLPEAPGAGNLVAVGANSASLDVNGDLVNDLLFTGSAEIEQQDLGAPAGLKTTRSSQINLSQQQADLTVQIVQDGADGNAGLVNTGGTEDFYSGTVIDATTGVFINLGDLFSSSHLLYNESDGIVASSVSPLSVLYNETQDADGNNVVDGPVFVGFRYFEAGSLDAYYGFVQLDEIDNDLLATTTYGSFESALTVVGYAVETQPNVGITTFAIVPEPTSFVALGGLLSLGLRRRRTFIQD